MVRKKIGVILSKPEEEYPARMLRGIMSKAFELDYDVVIYTSFAKESTLTEYIDGETKIYDLINFDLLSGVIVLLDLIRMSGAKEAILRRIDRECKCPVVFVDSEYKDYDSVFVEDEIPFMKLTDHLIEKHGCKKILFLSGPLSVATTKQRLAGYKRSLEKHGMAIDESLISFDGNFWYDGAAQIAHEILDGKRPMPDALMCCGDRMAMVAANVFMEAGMEIGKDILITGYDAFDDAASFVPSITSVLPPLYEAGVNAVLKIDAKLKFITYKPLTGGGKVEIGCSCGCEEDENYTRKPAREISKNAGSTDNDLFESNMLEAMASCVDPNELIYTIDYFTFLVRTYKYFNLCLCDNWLDSENDFEKQNQDFTDYSDFMRLWIRSEGSKDEVPGTLFSKREVFPDYNADREKPAAFFIAPVHFLKRCLGYTVISFGDELKTYDRHFANWIKLVANALENMRIKTSLAGLAVRDILTGAYSRLGLEHKMVELMERSKNRKNRFFMLVADVDKLKEINDKYGHNAGDIAIKAVAEAMKRSMKNNEVCARIGGDEFVVVDCNDYLPDYPERFALRVREMIDLYNKFNDYPFSISVSLGGVCERAADKDEANALFEKADKLMYENKKKHHQLRID